MWTKEMVNILITKYEENELLYNQSHPMYLDRIERLKALLKICNDLKKINNDITVELIKRKIHTVRSQYMKELHTINNREKSGLISEDVAPKLWFFDRVGFLKPHFGTRKSMFKSSNLSESAEVDEEDTSELYSESEPYNKSNFHEENPLRNDIINNDDSDVSCYTKCHKSIRPKYRWSLEMLHLFINQFKKYEVLYDSKLKYSNSVRGEAFIKLLDEMQSVDRNINMEDIREKLRHFRKQYLNEMRYIKRAQENNETYIPKLWCFDALAKIFNDKCDTQYEIKIKNETTIDETSNAYSNESFEFGNVDEDIQEKIECDEESFTISNISMTKNIVNFETTYDYEIENGCEVVLDNLQPAKKLCKLKENCNNENPFREESIKLPQPSNSTKLNNNRGDTNYEWLGNLVVSQLDEISKEYRTEFAWDLQCLMRKYIVKSKEDNGEAVAKTSSGQKSNENNHETPSLTHDIVLPRSSNISLNISFV